MSISCNAVQDLIVLFQEKTVSEETRREIRDHLKGCRACRRVYREYAQLNREPKLEQKPEQEPELRFGELAARIRKRKLCRNWGMTGAFALGIGITILVTRAILRRGGRKFYGN